MDYRSNICGVSRSIKTDSQQLEEIFGFTPTINISSSSEPRFEDGKMVILSGLFLEIIGNDKRYNICNSGYSKTVGYLENTGAGSFEGRWDEIGKKLASLYFSQLTNGSIIFLNDQQRTLLKNDDGTVDLLKEDGSLELLYMSPAQELIRKYSKYKK